MTDPATSAHGVDTGASLRYAQTAVGVRRMDSAAPSSPAPRIVFATRSTVSSPIKIVAASTSSPDAARAPRTDAGE